MAKHMGIKIPDDLMPILQTEKAVAILATFSEKGLPHAVPVHLMYPKGTESILLSLHKDHPAYHNMVWQKKVVLCFVDENNVSYSILGRAGVVRAPSMVHPLMNVVRVDIIEIENNRSPLITTFQGTRWNFASSEAQELSEALMGELKELSETL